MSRSNLNGSVDLLADAMRRVFKEAVEEAVQPLADQMETGFRDQRTEFNDRIQTTDENMAAQFVAQEKKISRLIKGQRATK